MYSLGHIRILLCSCDEHSVKNHWSINKQIKLNGISEASYGVKGFIHSLADNYTRLNTMVESVTSRDIQKLMAI